MAQTATANVLLRRLYPWIGRAIHVRWTRRRAIYQSEAEAILSAIAAERGPLPRDLRFRLEGFLGRLHREWFPPTWRHTPTYEEVVGDFEWWLGLAERWREPAPHRPRARRQPKEPPADQPKGLLRMLALPPNCSQKRFQNAWRRFLKSNHPDLNPDQSPEERRRFAEAVGLRRR